MATQSASLFSMRELMERMKQQEGLKKELEIVREIQNRLLPESFPNIPGLSIGGKCHLSERGGGDYYDVVELKGKIRGVMADVSGHNVGSALTMASFRSMFHSLVLNAGSIGTLLDDLRPAMLQELESVEHFISCWVFEYQKGKLSISGAGHPPLFIYRNKNKTWESYESKHLPLGVPESAWAPNTKLSLKAGDLALFYTDGLFDPHYRETGISEKDILNFVAKNHRMKPQNLSEKLFEWIKPHHQLVKSPDDVAVLILKKS